MNGSKVKSRRRLIAAAVCLLALAAAWALTQPVHASTKFATESQGRYSYFKIVNAVWRLDGKTGKTKKIKTIKSASSLDDFRVYGKYVYFTVNKHPGTDDVCNYIYRMKTNGKSLKKLAVGSSPYVRNGKIYYVGEKTQKQYGTTVTRKKGVYVMKTSGKSKKRLIRDSNFRSFAVASNRIFLSYYSGYFSEYSLKGKYSGIDRPMPEGVTTLEGTKSGLFAMSNAANGVVRYVTYPYLRSYTDIWYGLNSGNPSREPIGVRGGYAFVCDRYFRPVNGTYRLYGTMRMQKPGKKAVKVRAFTNLCPQDVLAKNGKWIVFRVYLNSPKKNAGVAKIKTNGKGYKILKTYFRS